MTNGRPQANPFDEARLKSRLVDFLILNGREDDILATEVGFADFKRRADLIKVNQEVHAFEIKSDIDNLDKLECQLLDYRTVFDRVTVVTTEIHLKNVSEKLPHSIGILLVTDDAVVSIRPAKELKSSKKYRLSCFLSGQDIRAYLKESGVSYSSIFARGDIASLRNLIVKRTTRERLREMALNSLKEKYGEAYKTFLNFRGDETHPEDLKMLVMYPKINVGSF